MAGGSRILSGAKWQRVICYWICCRLAAPDLFINCAGEFHKPSCFLSSIGSWWLMGSYMDVCFKWQWGKNMKTKMTQTAAILSNLHTSTALKENKSTGIWASKAFKLYFTQLKVVLQHSLQHSHWPLPRLNPEPKVGRRSCCRKRPQPHEEWGPKWSPSAPDHLHILYSKSVLDGMLPCQKSNNSVQIN